MIQLVVTFRMSLKLANQIKVFPACFTDISVCSGMNSHVALQCPIANKNIAAYSTGQVFVKLCVALQRSLGVMTLSADATQIRFFTVSGFVSRQVVLDRKLFVTNRADVRLRLRMDLHVFLQIRKLAEVLFRIRRSGTFSCLQNEPPCDSEA